MLVSSNDNALPYVISDDLYFVFDIWSKNSGLSVPDRPFFSACVAEIKATLETVFPHVVAVDGSHLRDEMSRMTAKLAAPVISMDKIYMPHVNGIHVDYLDVTRAVSGSFEAHGLVGRADPMRPRALHESFAELAQKFAGRDVTLVDDVVFTGNSLIKVMEGLGAHDIRVTNVVAGISVGRPEGMLAPRGAVIESVYNFPDVVDEICCRDFIVAAGGRTILTHNASNEGQLSYAPYLYPFGHPEQWASIPAEHVETVSSAMMQISKKIWNEIGAVNNRPIAVAEIGHRVWGLEDAGTVVASIDRAIDTLGARSLQRACA